MAELRSPAVGLLVTSLHLAVHPFVYLSRIRRHPSVFAGKFANFVAVAVKVPAVNWKIDVVFLFVFISVEDSNTVSADLWLSLKPVVFQRIPNFLSNLLGR